MKEVKYTTYLGGEIYFSFPDSGRDRALHWKLEEMVADMSEALQTNQDWLAEEIFTGILTLLEVK